MALNLDKVVAGSQFSGLRYVASTSGSVNIAGESFAATTNNGVVKSVTLTMPSASLLPYIRAQFIGLSSLSSAKWYPFSGGKLICIEGNVNILMITKGTVAGRTIYVNMSNRTSGTTSIGAYSINFYADLFAYPWQ